MIAVIYTSLVALVQSDMKKLIAYSSVAHMAIVTIGIFAFNAQGIEGAMIVMLSHGLVSAALFLCVGVIYDRLHTREIARYGGLVHRMPGLCAVLHAVHHGLGRPAGHQRLRRRVPGMVGALQGSTPGSPALRPPASSSGPPTCSISTAAWIFGEQVNEDLRASPTSMPANGPCSRR